MKNTITTLVFVFASIYAVKLPVGFEPCKRTNFNKCVETKASEFLKLMANGNKEVGFPSINPLKVTEMKGTSTGSVKFEEAYKDIEIRGLVDSVVESANFDFDKFVFEFIAVTPLVNLQGDYALNGQFSVFNINGHGRCNQTIENFKIKHKMTCKKYKEGGEEYLRVETYTTEFVSYNLHLFFENIVPGNEQLSAELNAVLDENANKIFEDAKSWHQLSYGRLFKKLANAVFSKVPYNTIFPE